MTIEVLMCNDCARLVVSVDGTRQTTTGSTGHGSGNCSGQWQEIASCKFRDTASILEEVCDRIKEMQ